MPYKNSEYTHIRRKHPSEIVSDTYQTIKITHIPSVRKKYPINTLARIGKSKKTGNIVIQSILIPIYKPTSKTRSYCIKCKDITLHNLYENSKPKFVKCTICEKEHLTAW